MIAVQEREEKRVRLQLCGTSPERSYTPLGVELIYVQTPGRAYRLVRADVDGRGHGGERRWVTHVEYRFPQWIRDLADVHMPGGRRTVQPLWRVKALSRPQAPAYDH